MSWAQHFGSGEYTLSFGPSGWRIGHAAGNFLIAEGSAYSAPVGKWLAAELQCGRVDVSLFISEADVVDRLTGIVMRNSGGSADPAVIRKVLAALRGERVSFVSNE